MVPSAAMGEAAMENDVIAGQQLNAATVLVNVERFAHGRTVGILTAHLHGNLGAS